MRVLRCLTLLTSVLALAACGRPESETGANSADSHAPGTTLAKKPGPCSVYAPGTPGVERSYCNGPATVRLTVDRTTRLLKGGSCGTTSGMFALNLGVVSGPDLGGPKPDYVGLTTPGGASAFSNAVISITVGGKSYALTTDSGSLTVTGGAFQGAASDGTAISGVFTC
ncbi:MAG: hypothetical protein JO303_02195 [Caulobacteraceae bacterium]|nr:hypothetical protein [Caulobacteraceae bacterium]